ncbi:MAG: restriction endonuclease [Candidatus Aenigmarchaeota archaeon]|nr:restriction endonuclease [Candidatus Aenigmarchaeota archaeon]
MEIIKAAGIPADNESPKRRERMALALLAVANMKPRDSWKSAMVWKEGRQKNWSLTTREIIKFWNKHYEQNISSGSYDDVRRKDLVLLVEAGIVLKSAGNPNASTNNPSRRYAVSEEAQDILKFYGKMGWSEAIRNFRKKFGNLADKLERRREQIKIPVKMPDGRNLELSFGQHNELQKSIIEEFLPRFAPGSVVLYVGDTSNKSLYLDKGGLRKLGFPEIAHDTLPDVVAYIPDKNWIFLVEAVHSSNPISKERHLILERMTKNCSAPIVYVSVFKDRKSMRQWLLDLSWETEVWLAESPEHLIHFDGNNLLEPYKRGRN